MLIATASEWSSVFVTALLGGAGVLVALSIRRDLQLKVAERRLASYERLWEHMRVVSPYDPPLGSSGREKLHGELTDWYYDNGDGMLLQQTTRQVYLTAKDNLIRPAARIVPQLVRDRLSTIERKDLDLELGRLSQRQLSLLRTQMKSDLEVYGRPYRQELDAEDRAFLHECGVDLARRPWKGGPVRAMGE